MFVLDDALMGFMFLVTASYSITFLVDEVRQSRNMKEYETSFVKLHEEIINKYQVADQSRSAEQAGDHEGQPKSADVSQLSEQTSDEDKDGDGKVPKWARAKGVIKLELANREKENLLAICKSYYSRWTLNRYVNNLFNKFLLKYDPREEVQFITFKKIDPPLKPVPIEIIRCNEIYAFVGTGDGSNDGYLLKTSTNVTGDEVPGVVFNLHGKLTIKEKKPEKAGEKSAEKSSETNESVEADDARGQSSHIHGKEEEAAAKEKRLADGESSSAHRELAGDISSSAGHVKEEEIAAKEKLVANEESSTHHELVRDSSSSSSSDEERSKEKNEGNTEKEGTETEGKKEVKE